MGGGTLWTEKNWMSLRTFAFATAIASALPLVSAAAQTCDALTLDTAMGETRCLHPGRGEQFKDCEDCPAMVAVPAGRFIMGSLASEPKREAAREDQVPVTIARPFAIGAFAVTRGEFASFVAATGHQPAPGCYFWTGKSWEGRADRSWQTPGIPQDDRHPVVCVDVGDAKAYAAWLTAKTGKTYRLPSEAEREYSTRAGTATPYWWGPSITTDRANYDGRMISKRKTRGVWRQRTVPVESFSPNPWGLFNVHGNVWDWTDECWNEKNQGNPADGSARAGGDCRWRVVRGGAWNYGPTYLRSAYRYWNEPKNRSSVQGFRVVRVL